MPDSVRTRRFRLLVGVGVGAALILYGGGGVAIAGAADPGSRPPTMVWIHGGAFAQDEFLKVLPHPSPQLALTAVGTDGMFACNAVAVDEALARHTRVYGYQFSDENAPQRYLPAAGFPYGASHTSELSYLFDVKAPFPGILSGAQVLLADQMQQYWTGFVKGVHARSAAGSRWPRMSAAGARPMIDFAAPAPVPRTDFAAEHHCAFWNGSGA
ncbi:carboxylesterase family protein [Catenulispora rubra]|uniref:carboxylesterase family protein n=1 Tax=Catenulispora rubra TaxID=280293 RepID=UPI0018925C1B|nr:carboxylesterase family protein [Catenulispora rubra]